MRRALILTTLLLAASTASAQRPAPPPEVFLLDETATSEANGSFVDIFSVTRLNGVPVENGIDRTEALYGRNEHLPPEGEPETVYNNSSIGRDEGLRATMRPILFYHTFVWHPGPVTVTLTGRHLHKSPADARTGGEYQVSGEIAFTPKPHTRYMVRGRIFPHSEVWLEDEKGNIVGGRIGAGRIRDGGAPGCDFETGYQFYVAAIDGKPVDDSLAKSDFLNSTSGDQVLAVVAERDLPIRPTTFTIVAWPHVLTDSPGYDESKRTSGDVRFTPQAGHHYKVMGAMTPTRWTVWIEDEETGRVMDRKIDLVPAPRLLTDQSNKPSPRLARPNQYVASPSVQKPAGCQGE